MSRRILMILRAMSKWVMSKVSVVALVISMASLWISYSQWQEGRQREKTSEQFTLSFMKDAYPGMDIGVVLYADAETNRIKGGGILFPTRIYVSNHSRVSEPLIGLSISYDISAAIPPKERRFNRIDNSDVFIAGEKAKWPINLEPKRGTAIDFYAPISIGKADAIRVAKMFRLKSQPYAKRFIMNYYFTMGAFYNSNWGDMTDKILQPKAFLRLGFLPSSGGRPNFVDYQFQVGMGAESDQKMVRK